MYTCYIKAQEQSGQYLIYQDEVVIRQSKFRIPETLLSEYLVLIDLLDHFLNSGYISKSITIYTESKKLVDQMSMKKDCGDLYAFWYEASRSIAMLEIYNPVDIVYDKEKVNEHFS